MQNKTIAIISVVLILVAVTVYFVNDFVDKNTKDHTLADDQNNRYHQAKVKINDIEILADIALTDEQRSKGLSVRDSLGENEGMLFMFQTESKHPFWMYGMKFPIDIFWLDSAGKIIHMESNLQPCKSESDCVDYVPSENALYVLETVAGFAEKHQIEIGTDIDFQLIR